MAGYAVILILMFLGLFGYLPITNQPLIGNNEYRAAIYSMEIDFSSTYELFPELQSMSPRSIISHLYFIEYGKNTLIEILDPGYEIEYLPVTIYRWDYSTGKFNISYFFNHVKKFHSSIDTIPFSIEESKGSTKNLCDGIPTDLKCDSVRFVLYSTNKEYTVLFNDTITTNLPARRLFYPDIKYLPSKIIREGRSNGNIQNLEQVIYGKPSIDSLLNLFNHVGYAEIPDEDWNYVDPQIEELIESLNRNKE